MQFRLQQIVPPVENVIFLGPMMNILLIAFLIHYTQCSPAPLQNDTMSPEHEEEYGKMEKEYNHITFNNGVQEGPYEKGGMPLISDSLFSLVILIYVSVAFLFVFFMFCWKNGNNGSGTMEGKETNGNLNCPLMSLEDIIGGKQQQ